MKKNILFAIIFFISITFICFDDISYKVLAVTGDYNRVAPGGGILLDDWNFLDEDMLLTDGNNQMELDLNINGNRIENLGSNGDLDELATIDYVSNQIVADLIGVQGGDVYTNWGRDDCASGDTTLYSGYGFGNRFNYNSGGENEICITTPFDGTVPNNGTMTDSLYPLMTGESVYFPSNDTTYQERTLIKCAVCYKEDSSCYLNIGTHQCSKLVFTNKAYDGYMVGELSGIASYQATSQTSCLNLNFDNSGGSASLGGSIWRGANIGDNFGISSYSENSFIKCAICCK